MQYLLVCWKPVLNPPAPANKSTNLYFFGEETTWNAYDCDVKAEIIGAVTPGALFGRAENCEYSDCSYEVTLDGKTLQNEVGETDAMYESLDQ